MILMWLAYVLLLLEWVSGIHTQLDLSPEVEDKEKEMEPVYIRRAGRFAVDEMCQCGHPKSDHGSRTHREGGEMIRFPGEGNCCITGLHCHCDKFRWAGWVYEDEKANAQEVTVY